MTNNPSKIWLIILLAIPFVILAWISVHIFAVFGVFISVAYMIACVFFPSITPDISKAFTKNKDCEETEKQSPPISKAIKGFLILLLLSILSVLAVYGETKVLEVAGVQISSQKAEFIIPDNKEYKIGEIFPIDITIDTHGTTINAVQADILFEPENIEIVKVSLEKSFANIFIQKEINNEKGYVRITGGLASPGYKGDAGLFATIYFEAKKAGIFDITFLPTSLALANDGNGTNILTTFPTSSYLVKPEYITDVEEQLQSTIILNDDDDLLGVTSTNDQMLFFDNDQTVLGTEDENSQDTSTDHDYIWKILLMIDNWILSILQNIFSI